MASKTYRILQTWPRGREWRGWRRRRQWEKPFHFLAQLLNSLKYPTLKFDNVKNTKKIKYRGISLLISRRMYAHMPFDFHLCSTFSRFCFQMRAISCVKSFEIKSYFLDEKVFLPVYTNRVNLIVVTIAIYWSISLITDRNHSFKIDRIISWNSSEQITFKYGCCSSKKFLHFKRNLLIVAFSTNNKQLNVCAAKRNFFLICTFAQLFPHVKISTNKKRRFIRSQTTTTSYLSYQLEKYSKKWEKNIER